MATITFPNTFGGLSTAQGSYLDANYQAINTWLAGGNIDHTMVSLSDLNVYITPKSIGMTSEASATSATSPVSLNLGTVTAGDRIFVQEYVQGTNNSSMTVTMAAINKASGSSTGIFLQSLTAIDDHKYCILNDTQSTSISGIWEVTGNGTLTLQAASGLTTINVVQIYAFFLKKQ